MAAVAVAASVSFGFGGSAAVAAPAAPAAVTVAAPSTGALTQGAAGVAVVVPAGAADAATVAVGETRGVIGAIVAAIKKLGLPVWNACSKAVKGGYNTFKVWYDGLPGPARTAIRVASGFMTVYDIYVALKDFIG